MEPTEVQDTRNNLYTRLGRHVPWFLMRWLSRNWSVAFQLLQYGTRNINNEQHWDHAWKRHGKDGFRATSEVPELRRLVLDAVPRGTKVLDVGCGVGEMMTLLRDQNSCDCFGLDIAPTAVAAVVAKGMSAKTAVLPSIPYPDADFDVVVSTETLEHVTNAKDTLREIRRILRPGGIFVVSVPDGSVDEETAHVHRFRHAKLHDLLSKYFIVDRIEVIQAEFKSLFGVARRPSQP